MERAAALKWWRRPALQALPVLRTPLRQPHQPLQYQQRCFKSSASTTRASPSTYSQRSVHHQRKEFLKLVPALRAFQERHGHLAVPLRFTVPSLKSQDDHSRDWPEELQSMKLGTTLSRFVKVAQKPANAEIAAKLAAMGVPVDSVADWKRHLWEQVAIVSLQTFYALHGHFFVPYSFAVPHDDEAAQWPRQTWGYKLGYWVIELRRDKSRLESYQLDDLRAMNFVWNAREARWNQYFVPAMKRYAELYGTKASVPQSFAVPRDDDRWPKELQGYRLGQKVNNLRCGGKSGSASSSDPAGDEMEWDDVELVYNNWLMLDILHEGEGKQDGDGAESTDAAKEGQ